MIKLTCHCGNIELMLSKLPTEATKCNCSICHRYGALWSYFPKSDVTITAHEQPAKGYLWGDREAEFMHCPICGCITHYETTERCDSQFVAVNMSIADIEVIEELQIKLLDKADRKR